MMLLKEMISQSSLTGNHNNDFTKKFDEFQTWLQERDKKASIKKPPTFSGGQVFLFVFGLGPFVGLAGLAAYAHMYQYTLDILRTLH